MPNTLIPIQTYTLSSTASSVTFSNIPQNYTDLKIVVSARASIDETGLSMQFNENTSTSNYSYRTLQGNGTSTASSTETSLGFIGGRVNPSTYTASTFSNNEYYIPNYAGNQQKTVSAETLNENNGATANRMFTAGLWNQTSAITSIKFYIVSGSLVAGSTFTLYGISNGVKASGGTITVAGGYAYHTFTSTGGFTPNEIIRDAEVLLVAGGGGGSSANGAGAGGGAGGVISSITGTLNAGSGYIATVGAGGSGSAINNSGNNGVTGNNSTFASAVVALGGGGGTATTDVNGYAQSGGSGGGATPHPSGTRFGGLGTVGQGNNGGHGNGTWGTSANGAGGGGGAGGIGLNGTASSSADGGVGTTAYTEWLRTTGTGVLSNGSYYIGGGGAGGARNTNQGGLGGTGGGADGSSTSTGAAGTANTGGGGAGAGGTNGLAAGGAGGSGLVIVRYPLS